jgi:hypothetical protein
MGMSEKPESGDALDAREEAFLTDLFTQFEARHALDAGSAYDVEAGLSQLEGWMERTAQDTESDARAGRPEHTDELGVHIGTVAGPVYIGGADATTREPRQDYADDRAHMPPEKLSMLLEHESRVLKQRLEHETRVLELRLGHESRVLEQRLAHEADTRLREAQRYNSSRSQRLRLGLATLGTVLVFAMAVVILASTWRPHLDASMASVIISSNVVVALSGVSVFTLQTREQLARSARPLLLRGQRRAEIGSDQARKSVDSGASDPRALDLLP